MAGGAGAGGAEVKGSQEFLRRRALLVVLAGSLAAGVMAALAAPEGMRSTRFGDYAPQVENLKAGRGFVDGEGKVLHRYPPLYPLMLWGLEGVSRTMGWPLYSVLAGCAILCNTAAAGLVWGLGRMTGLGAWQATVGAGAFALHPFVLYGVLLPLSETPFLVLLAGAVLYLMTGMGREGARWAVWGGGLLGLACLVRPIALPMAAVLAGIVVWRQPGRIWSRVSLAALLLTAWAAVTAPWVLWVRARSGQWVAVSSGGPPTLRDGLSFNHKAFRDKLALPNAVARTSDAAWAEYERLDSTDAFAGFLMRRLQEDPWGVMVTYLYKAGRAWYGTDAQRSGTEQFNLAVSGVFLTAVAAGAWRCRRRGWPRAAWLLAGGAVTLWGMAAVALSIARYTMPAVAMLAPFAGWNAPGSGAARARESRRMALAERIWVRMRESLARYRAEAGVRDEAVRVQREWLGDLRGKRVLEIGCGAGNVLTMEIARASGEYWGVDLAAERVEKLEKKLKAAGLDQARAVAGDVLEPGWAEGRFDVIYAGSVLHAFADVERAAEALERLLKPGGVMVAWEPMNTGWAVRLARALYRPFQPNRAWHHPLRVKDVERWGAHFRLEGARGFLGWSKWGYPVYVMPGGRRLGAWLGRRLRWWDEGRRGLRGCHQVVLKMRAEGEGEKEAAGRGGAARR